MLIIKSTLGRFFQAITPEQLDDPTIDTSLLGIAFRLKSLELNRAVINELLEGSPLRLVAGTVESISGSVSLNGATNRSFQLEGIDLTFDFVRCRRPHSDASMLRSSIVEDISRQYVDEVSTSPSSDSKGAVDLTEGIQQVTATLRAFVHSLTATISNVTIRFRCPPQGSEIPVSGPCPEGTVEVMIHLKGAIDLRDETDVNRSFGNSFRKKVLFSGLRVALYDATSRQELETVDEVTQVVDLADTILSGDIDAKENQWVVEYQDVDERRPGRPDESHPLLKSHMVIKQVHAVLSPKQLARLSIIANFFGECAPTNNDDATSTRCCGGKEEACSGATSAHSNLQFEFHDVSCYALCTEFDYRDVARHAWRNFPHTSFQASLTAPHYAIRLKGARLAMSSGNNVSLSFGQSDPYSALFRTVGGHRTTIGASSVDVIEKLSSRAVATPMLRLLRNSPNDAVPLGIELRMSNAMSTQQYADLAGGISTSSSAAFVSCVSSPSANLSAAVHHRDVNISLGRVECEFDVEILDRLFQFWSLVDAHWLKQTFNSAHSQQHVSGVDLYGEPAHVDVEEMLRNESSYIDRVLPTGSSAPSHANLQLNHLVFHTTTSVYCAGLAATISFPTHRTPNIDVYGPLTQRLFRELAHLAQLPEDLPEQLSSADVFLTKQLRFSLNNVRIDVPVDDADCCVCNVDNARCDLIDVLEKSSTTLFTVDFETSSVTYLNPRAEAFHPRRPGKKSPSIILCFKDSAASDTEMKRVASTWAALKALTGSNATQDFLHYEELLLRSGQTAVAVSVSSVDVRLHQDELLLFLFLVDQIVECVNLALEFHGALLEKVEQQCQRHLETGGQSTPSPVPPVQGSNGTSPGSELLFSCVSLVEDDVSLESRMWEIRQRIIAGLKHSSSMLSSWINIPSQHHVQVTRSHASTPTGADSSTIASTCINGSIVAAHVSVFKATVTLLCPRLAASGLPFGEPLFMLLPKHERDAVGAGTTPESLFHKYTAILQHVAIVVHQTSSDSVGVTELKLRVGTLDSYEQLPPLPSSYRVKNGTPTVGTAPSWGNRARLLNSYQGIYNKAFRLPNRPRHSVVCHMHKVRDAGKLCQTTSIALDVDRCFVHHLPAHEGDHWLLVLMNFVTDVPVVETTVENETDSPEAANSSPAPMATSTSVAVSASDLIFQYLPYGQTSQVALIVPQLVVQVGPIVSTAPTLKVEVSLDKVALLLHPECEIDLFATESLARGQTHVDPAQRSAFGDTGRGIAADLEALGFVQIVSVQSDATVEKNITLAIHELSDKPIFVKVQNLKLEVACAPDSFASAMEIISHFTSAKDIEFIPSPYSFATEFSTRFAVDSPLESSKIQSISSSPSVRVLVDHFADTIAELTNTSWRSLSHNAEQSRSDSPPPIAPLAEKSHVVDEMDSFDFIDDDDFHQPKAPTAARCFSWSSPSPIASGSCERLSERILASSRYISVKTNPNNFKDIWTSPARLEGLPPIDTEIVVVGCHAEVKLFGGSDFGGKNDSTASSVDEPEFITVRLDGTTSDSPCVNKNKSPFSGSQAANPPLRNTAESISIQLDTIFLQLDLFPEGYEQIRRILFRVREFEVVDNIAGSCVSKICMHSIPRQFRDSSDCMFHTKWTTCQTKTPAGSFGRPEEEVTVSVQPLRLSLHRRAIDLVVRFLDDPRKSDDDPAETSTLYFRHFTVCPVNLQLSVYLEVRDFGAAWQGDVKEIANFLPSLENSSLVLPYIRMSSFPATDFGLRAAEALGDVANFENVLLVLCGLQPVRTVSEAGAAAADLVLQPLQHYKRHKNLYRGIVRGINIFARRFSAEGFRAASGAAHSAHEALHAATSSIHQQEPLRRGAQPHGIAEGLSSGATEIVNGFRNAGQAIRHCLSDDGSITALPLAMFLTPLDGVMRGMSLTFIGLRNAVKPEARILDAKIFK